MSSRPPPLGGQASRPPGPPPSRRHQTRVDEPFATPSFAPPPMQPAPAAPTTAPPPVDLDDDELELRPSFIGRLKRLFVKKRPSGF
jgi:hypothetical protein